VAIHELINPFNPLLPIIFIDLQQVSIPNQQCTFIKMSDWLNFNQIGLLASV
jgi:hypothetical protein